MRVREKDEPPTKRKKNFFISGSHLSFLGTMSRGETEASTLKGGKKIKKTMQSWQKIIMLTLDVEKINVPSLSFHQTLRGESN